MYVEVRGQKTFFSTGSGHHKADAPCIVFIHGAGFDHTIWTLPARYFARQGFNVAAIDLPGHGRSAGEALKSVEEMAAWVGDVMDALAFEKAAIVGHSMGTLIAMTLAASQPEKVSKLALLGTSTPMPVSDALLDSAEANSHTAIDMANGWSFGNQAQQGGNENPGLAMTMVGQRLLEKAGPGVFHADLAACNEFVDGDQIAAKVTAPALVIVGMEDKMTRPKGNFAVAASVSAAKIVELEGCGHSMLIERPNLVLDALIEMLV